MKIAAHVRQFHNLEWVSTSDTITILTMDHVTGDHDDSKPPHTFAS